MPTKRLDIARIVPKDFKLTIQKSLEIGRTLRMYQPLPVYAMKEYEHILVNDPDKEFTNWVASEVNAYLMNEKSLAPEIKYSIMNIADDILSGKDASIRAGDYIALQTYFRKK